MGTWPRYVSATRAKYHYAVRKVKRDQERIVANKMAESLNECKPTQFWDHEKKSEVLENVIQCLTMLTIIQVLKV